jgi:hypothetical protein
MLAFPTFVKAHLVEAGLTFWLLMMMMVDAYWKDFSHTSGAWAKLVLTWGIEFFSGKDCIVSLSVSNLLMEQELSQGLAEFPQLWFPLLQAIDAEEGTLSLNCGIPNFSSLVPHTFVFGFFELC